MEIAFDTPFRAGDIYTRANVGEVFPDVISPFVWSLIGPGVEAAFVDCITNDLGTPLPEGTRTGGGHYAVSPRAAGRMHLNLSILRRGAEMLPGSSAADLDRQYFGDAVASGLPAHPAEKYPLGVRLRAVRIALRTMLTIDKRVARHAAAVAAAQTALDAFLAGGPDAAALLDELDRLLPLHSTLFATHVTARALTSSAVSLAAKSLARSGLDDNAAMARVSSLPGLESAQPSIAVARIAAGLPDGELRDAVAAGLTWDALTARTDDAAAALRGQVEEFRARFGHRGVNEFDPAARTWATNPDAVLAMLRPVVAAGALPPADAAPSSGRTPWAIGNARKAILRAETTKDNVIRVTHLLRRLTDALAVRLADRLGRDDLLALTVAEVRDVVAGAAVPAEAVALRKAELADAAAVLPAEWSVGAVTLRPTHVEASDAPLTGLAGSPGTATGRVRVMRAADDPFEDGEVLVAVVTDTAWTPLFLAACAVVTDQGGPLSHATIVARELGIPAVVNTKTASLALRDGDLVEVDGGAGVVRVLERAGVVDVRPAEVAAPPA